MTTPAFRATQQAIATHLSAGLARFREQTQPVAAALSARLRELNAAAAATITGAITTARQPK